MAVKRLSIALFLTIISIMPLSAAMVSFLVIETGFREDVPVQEFTSLWENGLMDAFFDAGHIVSNAPIIRLVLKPKKELPDEARADLDEAMSGGAEFFILALLDYQGVSDRGVGRPQSIALRLFRTKSGTLLFEQQYPGVPRASSREERATIKKAAQAIMSQLRR